ncbi:peptidase domain-containing ABC transporter [Flavobacterium subsaxonicum]|uniref:ABC transporter ATP-binding protein n=1 Tax=Flavobacterium subsaxonicum WB 4.1-42 = DSM 21790 TaxID=1121898 RepID=A0A0A2MQG0_9FLAO|nr:ATP-binding cassette domain-containing protein [Flavobacterium subsaxonicum]KGO94927.1 ABC transporter ATP-binding protein [Flavobacterium subsaxonicum WB 4.1-42 = DSM 21790]
MTPLQRFYNLLRLDKRDVYQILFYAAFAGLVNLSLPLGVQAIINFIQSGQFSVSWIILVILVTLAVGFGGVLNIMQLRIVENLQQRIFVRSSFEFAYRMPLIKFKEMHLNYAPEKANRFFDTLMVQKGTAKLLLDFSTAFLQISFGIILLSLYHSFFMVIGLLFIAILYIIFKFSYKDGLETSLKESKFKYKVAAWLQEIARNRDSFRKKREFEYALDRNDKYVSEYVSFREKHFGVMKKQYIQLVVFKVIVTAALLSIGGFLVMNHQMNIGQFVAAEIVIVLLINSVEKVIFGLESFYDVLTSVEKIGQVTDMETHGIPTTHDVNKGGITIETESMGYFYPGAEKKSLKNIDLKISQGEKILVTGANGAGKSTLLRLLSGILEPESGAMYVTDDYMNRMDEDTYRAQSGTLLQGETLFDGTIRNNILFGNNAIDNDDLKWALDKVELSPYIKTFPNGLETHIHPSGSELSASDIQKILLARSIVHKPNILFLEEPTSMMDEATSDKIIDFLLSAENKWTVIVASKNNIYKDKCNRMIAIGDGKIINDIKL